MRISVIGALLLFAAMANAQDLTGDWVGTMELAGRQFPLRVHFDPSGSSGHITMLLQGAYRWPLASVQVDVTTVNFDWKSQSAVWKFHGKRKGNKMTGEVIQPETSGSFQLLQIVQTDPRKYFGVYELAPDRYIYIRTWDELGENQPTYFDDQGRVGALYASSETEFFSGTGIWIPFPAVVNVTFRDDGLDWLESDRKAQVAKKISLIKEEEVTFRNGEVSLGGSLILPAKGGPHPAIVFVHGSGPVSRDFFGPLPFLFARHGYAVLCYDKRGIGASGGNWLEADFQTLAEDALAAVQYLKTRSEINAKKIGMWGGSQAGWVMPYAASQSDDVSFLMLISSPAVTPAEQDLQAVQSEMRLQGIPEAEIQENLKKRTEDLNLLRSDEAVMGLEEEVRQLQQKGDNELLAVSTPDNPKFLLFLRMILDFDPVPYWEKVKCPIQILYGELDQGVPVEGNKEKLEAALKRGGNSRYSIEVLPKGNHALLLSETGSSNEFPYLKRFVPGFFDKMLDWLRKNLLTDPL